ncbi:hypothetical protein A6768_12675 [Sphingobium yanoikuyae]|uniref:Uncharacterized protein n=1 Tax=Sphingobium yanoikuyae TaxID=13690 RepID=A0A291N0G7_SPHYA|nr:hypothetical protein A6768_12675 [Sphingobium yanoikuyae]
MKRNCSSRDNRSGIPTGTVDFAARLTIPADIAIQRRFAHLRALRDYWHNRFGEMSGIKLMLPSGKGHYGRSAHLVCQA